jgi:hypothetical protein
VDVLSTNYSAWLNSISFNSVRGKFCYHAPSGHGVLTSAQPDRCNWFLSQSGRGCINLSCLVVQLRFSDVAAVNRMRSRSGQVH